MAHYPAHIHSVFTRSDWKNLQHQHEEGVKSLLGDYMKQRSFQKKNPVIDFLFEYYSFRFSQLVKWSPGIRFGLAVNQTDELKAIKELTSTDATAYLDVHALSSKKRQSFTWIHSLLTASRDRKPSFGCFGMHEWAMVYRSEHVRHQQLPLRLSSKEIMEVVESRPLLCTHFHAFRFFTKPAQPFNKYDLTRERFTENEQAGCIHTNMDLYKWAFKGFPWISSDLIFDAFKLASHARRIDMKASPYDVSAFGLAPIPIETEEGRRVYKEEQERIYEASIPVRERLIREYEYILECTSDQDPSVVYSDHDTAV
ncbi:MAG: 3-methyladenine DNA glycosylase [Bacteroidota bacterium]